LELIMLPLGKIRLDPGHVRGLRSLDSVAGLSESIQQVGVLHPVIVQPDGEYYRLVAGYRRWLAATRAGWDEIPALVLSEGANVLLVQLAENLQREDLNPLERALAVRAFMESEKLSVRAAAKKLGIPRTTITDWLDVLAVEERFQRAVVDNFYGGDSPLTVSHIAEARALAAALGSPGIATALLDAVLLYNLTKAETRAVARLIRQNVNLSIRDAVRAVRPHPASLDDESASDRLVPPDEENLAQLIRAMDQSAAVLKRFRHLSGRHLSPEQRQQLLERVQQLRVMAEEALERLTRWPQAEQAAPRRQRSRRVS
jgi:ParB-like partition proteins